MKNIITVVSILFGIHMVLSQEVTQKQFVNFTGRGEPQTLMSISEDETVFTKEENNFRQKETTGEYCVSTAYPISEETASISFKLNKIDLVYLMFVDSYDLSQKEEYSNVLYLWPTGHVRLVEYVDGVYSQKNIGTYEVGQEIKLEKKGDSIYFYVGGQKLHSGKSLLKNEERIYAKMFMEFARKDTQMYDINSEGFQGVKANQFINYTGRDEPQTLVEISPDEKTLTKVEAPNMKQTKGQYCISTTGYSKEAINTFSFKMNKRDIVYAFFDDKSLDQTYNLSNGIYLYNNGSVYHVKIDKGKSTFTVIGNYKANDLIEMELNQEESRVRFYINGEEIYRGSTEGDDYEKDGKAYGKVFMEFAQKGTTLYDIKVEGFSSPEGIDYLELGEVKVGDHSSCVGCSFDGREGTGEGTGGTGGGGNTEDLSTENYIRVKEPFTATENADMVYGQHSTTYYDGLGRAMQGIVRQQSTSKKDIVTPIVYDEYGRHVKDYLPYASSQNTGMYIENNTAISGVESYYTSHYSDTVPFSEKKLEASPLNRVLKQAAPGEAWKLTSGHEIEFGYETNVANEVKRFDANTDGDFVPSLEDKGYYGAGELYKTVTRDENHTEGKAHTIEEFKDKEGRVVLKRTYGEVGTSQTVIAHDTYYVYDIYGNLSYVLPPKLSKQATLNQELLTKLGYQYQYDDRNRLVEKQLPGKDREYLVYDKQDRLVATQDGNLQEVGEWLFTKYDQFGRVLYTGITVSSDRESVQKIVNGKGENNEEKGSFVYSGITVPYTNEKGFPVSIKEILTVNVYDAYPSESPSVPTSIEGQELISSESTPNLKGLQVATYTRVLPSSDFRGGWTRDFMYYDQKSRLVRTYSQNYKGGYTVEDSKLDFRGKEEYKVTRHRESASTVERSKVEYFTYDHAERLVKLEQEDTGNGTKITLVENVYDELGQLKTKKVGDELQKVDYKYNIRGWLTGINDISNLESSEGGGSDLFAFKINYDNVQTSESTVSNVKGLFNGNISETFWRTKSDNIKRGYAYLYDALNRIKAGYYLQNNRAPGYYNVGSITYDENGNIQTLNRTGTSNTRVVLMDKLRYIYDEGNQLLKVGDTSKNEAGFKNGSNTDNDYTYDVNGNMMIDQNKGITNIEYNHLNLPIEIAFAGGNKIEYLYDAAGMKLQKKVIEEGKEDVVTDYLDGYQYVDGKLEFYPHAEGYVNMKSGIPEYVYNYTDHLGNVRVSYVNDNGEAKIVEESNYYPFGLKHKGYNNNANLLTDKYKYGYNGKEEQDELGLNWSDYGARNYDASLGRWMNVDPLADKPNQINWSPYSYTFNNPIRFTDPTGMAVDHEYEIDKKGNVNKTKHVEGSTTDTLTSTETGASVEVQDQNLLPQLVTNTNFENTPEGTKVMTTATTENGEDAVNVFTLAAESTDVEFSLVKTKDDNYSIGTFHENDRSPGVQNFGLEDGNVSAFIHSHPSSSTDRASELESMGYSTIGIPAVDNKTGERTIIKRPARSGDYDRYYNRKNKYSESVYFKGSKNVYQLRLRSKGGAKNIGKGKSTIEKQFK